MELISIHTPREGSDGTRQANTGRQKHFNPHSPRGERHILVASKLRFGSEFQSTLPARGATQKFADRSVAEKFQSTLPARGATPVSHGARHLYILFQSTLPARGATGDVALRVAVLADFNPHSPRGERPGSFVSHWHFGIFQSTLPARGATGKPFPAAHHGLLFQSTLPARGATCIFSPV